MYQIATTTASVLRGTSTNAYGDVMDTGAAYLTGLPAYLTESLVRVFDPASQTPRLVRTATAMLPFGTDVTENDQIHDEKTGVTYAIEAVVLANIPGRNFDVQLELRRVT